MNIGQVAHKTELPAKTIRYYEEIDLVSPVRAENGYRTYSDQDIHRLIFLKRSRSLGFSIDECRVLLSLYDDEHRASADVKVIAQAKISQIDQKIAELQSLKSTLSELVAHCHGDNMPDCPILDGLSSDTEDWSNRNTTQTGCCEREKEHELHD
ncbi:Cu(I)-responsive transcriptional regulator [Cohaesibacter sp. ES.047]|uniref:Cu(I)-responsive transcriptional regulator n=1 Tax=Cohaesibacter sp. ES.047 TaxID=1798205 RepID=UPI000BB988FD|nr:Cu(I)-responsive transcriptional regulator [Cohaesibacter sp. ES.047]SNY93358.1 Cu(I)-responsive transcriptional regulator [Cohaesibacter sp. ES.047]